ncbi:MAG: lipoprotein-releasing ABC transporter permease subunit [Alphaproteobacteria bacterium]
MFDRFERMLAGRYLRARRKEGFISVIAGFSLSGIALGVATLIVVLAVMNGFRGELLGRILGLNGHANVFPQTVEDTTEVITKLRDMEEVTTAIPMIEDQAFVTKGERSRGVLVRAFEPIDFANKEIIAKAMADGKVEGEPSAIGQNQVAIGHRLAGHLRATVGDTIRLISPQAKVGPLGSVFIRHRDYTISAVYEVGMVEYDSNFIFMGLEDARKFFRMAEGQITAIEVMVKDPDAMGLRNEPDSLQNRMRAQIGDGNYLRSWEETNAQFFGALQVERNVMFLILTLIILVAAFNIISSLIMLVKDKGKDIAILRTMGATPGGVMRIFLMTGTSIGLTGTLVGLLLGVAFAENIQTIQSWVESAFGTKVFPAEIYFLSTLPATVDYREVAQVVLMGIGLSFLATIYPSWRASRLDPVEALRYE